MGRVAFLLICKGSRRRANKHCFDPAVCEADITVLTCYCLRHAFSIRLEMAGMDLRTVAELTGHKAILMRKRYAHLGARSQWAAVEKLAAEWETDRPTDTKISTDFFGPSFRGMPVNCGRFC